MTQTKNKKQNFDKKGKKKKEFLNESNTKQKKKRKEKKNIPQIFELIEVYGCLINRFFFTFFFFLQIKFITKTILCIQKNINLHRWNFTIRNYLVKWVYHFILSKLTIYFILFYLILSILCLKLILYYPMIRYTKIHKSTDTKIDHIYSSYLSIRVVK